MRRTFCVQKLFFVFVLTFRTIHVHNMFSTCSQLGIFLYWTCNSTNNLLSYFGLIEVRMRASDKKQPVQVWLSDFIDIWVWKLCFVKTSEEMKIRDWIPIGFLKITPHYWSDNPLRKTWQQQDVSTLGSFLGFLNCYGSIYIRYLNTWLQKIG